MHLRTMHLTKFYLNVIIISEVIYCSMCENFILKKTTMNIFLHFFIHKPKIRCLNCASRENLSFLELLNKFAMRKGCIWMFYPSKD